MHTSLTTGASAELAGVPRPVLMEALKVLERRGKARCASIQAPDGLSVTFFGQSLGSI